MILSSLKHIVNVVPLIGHLRWKTLCKSGKISGDTFHQSFMEWAICRYEVDKMCQEQPFVCPPCTPEMLAVAVDGNRKHYRFKKAGSQDSHGHLEGVFLCEDSKVSEFVDHVHKATKPSLNIQSLQQQKDSLEALTTELSVDNSTILQWVTDAPVEDSDAPVELQKKMEEMSASIRQRTHRLYRQNDTNKGRHRMSEEKGKLAALVLEHNTLVQPSERVESVELIFQPEYIFPWHVPTSDTDILTKKKVFEKVMGIRRLEEEEVVLVKEMKQHWEYLKRRAEVLEQSISGDCWNLSPKGRKGLQSLHQRKLTELKSHQAVVRQMYLQHLHLDLTEPDLDLEELLEEGQECLSSDTSSDDDENVNT
ncbi:uncharacterized protein LOC134038087 [Osmerus eperlanus]|uniref:uncharacterized protein LOC134038087 n=1 Tax=Osmerus eperlanus TaxID=29151 RepID=UPI002E1090CF